LVKIPEVWHGLGVACVLLLHGKDFLHGLGGTRRADHVRETAGEKAQRRERTTYFSHSPCALRALLQASGCAGRQASQHKRFPFTVFVSHLQQSRVRGKNGCDNLHVGLSLRSFLLGHRCLRSQCSLGLLQLLRERLAVAFQLRYESFDWLNVGQRLQGRKVRVGEWGEKKKRET
jgi:hypothetical protein